MNILKRQLALLLVLAITLTMLPMPAHADEVTEPESPSAIVEESTEKPMVSKEEVSSDTANKPVENAEPDTTAKETPAPATEIPVDTAVDSNTTTTEELIADVSEDTPASDPVEKSEAATDTEDPAEDPEVEENTESDPTAESEEDSSAVDTEKFEDAEDSESDTQEETEQIEAETEVPVAAAFSLRRSAANAAADCTHENTTFVVDSREDYWYYLHTNEAQHVANYYAGYKCDDCGVMVSQVRDYFAEDHVMNENSVCTLCGYGAEEDSCAHSETEVAWDTKHTVTYDPVSNTQHKVEGYQYTYCTSCFERVGESFAAEEYEGHSLNTSGKCFLCGYQSSENTGCAHENTEEKFYFNNPVRYAQFNEEEHYIYRAGTIYCHDCRTDIGSSNTEQWSFEAHTLNNEGNCVYCGYGLGEGYCTHPNSRVIMDSDQEKAYYQKDENQHLVNFYQYHYCPDCNSRISESFLNATWEDHDFDASGVCTLCGEAWVCSHPADAREDVALSFSYLPFNDAQHQKFGSWCPFCIECNQPVGESFPTEELEDHVLNESGECTLCGYESNVETGCTHEYWVYDYSKLDDPPRYEQYDYLKHWVNHNCFKRCVDCGTILPGIEETSSLESHVLNDDGKCTYCGYGFGEDYCEHPASEVMWDTDYAMTYTSLNDEQHEIESYQYHYCTSCYKRICASFPVMEREDHTTDATGDCTLCDYRVGCAHSETRMKLYDTLYESLNKDSHEVTRLYSKVCADPDCGKVLVSVETSYTETDIEDHDFTGNTCLLCKYTVADQLGATVTASGQTANKGERISASVSVVGGTGGYRYSWKVLKDGSVKAGSPITTDASYDYLANEEGSYVFQVTVTDSGGNTVTAQSDTIAVKHVCQYVTVTETAFTMTNETQHKVTTTTYEECSICHEKINKVETENWVTHTPKNPKDYTYRTGHPHQRYAVCECGKEFNVTGEFEKVNGKLLEPDVCCICHGHKYGEAKEAADGTWKKICANCGLSQKVAAPVQPTEPEEEEEKHVHSYHDIEYIDGTAHPHRYVLTCSCGHKERGEGSYMLCCQCVGHSMGDAIKLSDGTYREFCSRCNLMQTATPSGKVQNYYDVIDIIINRKDTAAALKEMETGNFALWKVVAVEAAEELTGWGFVFTNELLNNFSENANVVGAAKAFKEQYITPETWNDQQVDLWKDLLIQMLQSNTDSLDDIKNTETASGAAGTANKDFAAYVKVIGNSESKRVARLNELNKRIEYLDDQVKVLNEKIDNYKETAEIAGESSFHFKNTIELLEENKAIFEAESSELSSLEELQDFNKYDTDSTKSFQTLGYALDVTGICLSSIGDAASAYGYASLLGEIKSCTKNVEILNEIIETAHATGNTNLENAASELKEDIIDASVSNICNVLDSVTELISSATVGTIEWAVNQIAEQWATLDSGSLGVLDTLSFVAIGIKGALGWGPVYDEAEMLMTYNQMDANMNIVQVLKNEDAPYMAELWGLLQAEGCACAQDFLTKWRLGNGLDEMNLGIKDGGISAVNKALTKDRNYYIDELNLPLEKSK